MSTNKQIVHRATLSPAAGNFREMIESGDPPARKALLQSLVHEIRVVSREEIYPTFNLPAFAHRAGRWS